jgi:hypothetical protein
MLLKGSKKRWKNRAIKNFAIKRKPKIWESINYDIEGLILTFIKEGM